MATDLNHILTGVRERRPEQGNNHFIKEFICRMEGPENERLSLRTLYIDLIIIRPEDIVNYADRIRT